MGWLFQPTHYNLSMKNFFTRWFGNRTLAPPSPRPAPPPADRGVEQFLFRLPKVEVGIELERCLRPAQFLSLAKKYDLGLAEESEAEARRLLRFRDHSSFEEVESLIRRVLRNPEDLHLLTQDLLAEQAIQKIRHSEVHLHLAAHLAAGMDGEALRQALVEATQEGQRRHGVALRFLVCLRPEEGQRAAEQALEWIESDTDGLVVGIHLASIKQAPSAPFLSLLETVGSRGLRRTGYAETAEAAQVLLAECSPERLTLAAPAATSEILAALASRHMGAILRPVEDLRLGICPGLESHPIAECHGQELISLATGGGPLFGTNLTREYVNLHRFLGVTTEELVSLARRGVRQSFLTDDGKLALEEELSQAEASEDIAKP